MFWHRRPRYLIDEHGELRQLYYRDGSWFPLLDRALKPDRPNLTAALINGKWVLVETDSNEQRKTVEIQHKIERRTNIALLLAEAAVLTAGGYEGVWGYRWTAKAADQFTLLAYRLQWPFWTYSEFGREMVQGLLGAACYMMLIYAGLAVLRLFKPVSLELLYWLRFPFMKGARAIELPRQEPARPPIEGPWNAGYEDPRDASERMRDPG
jgi:hypothetical protein